MKNNYAVLRDIEAVLDRHGASLFFEAPARLWINGEDTGEIWHVEGGDGSRLEPVSGLPVNQGINDGQK